MRTRLRRDLMTAMKARDAVATAALRSVLGALDNAEAQPVGSVAQPTSSEHVAGASLGAGSSEVPRHELSAAEEQDIIRREADDRETAAQEYDQGGRADHGERLRAEAQLLRGYLDAG